MTVLLKNHKLLFVSAPKVACTSIKTALFEVENGFEFQPFHANGFYRHIHDMAVYPAIPFSKIPTFHLESFLKLTLVRDPLARFLSAYSNRVLHYKELSEQQIGAGAKTAGVPVDPTLADFVANLEIYRNLSGSIRLHTDPLINFLGEDPTFYDHIFRIPEMKIFDETVSKHIGQTYSTPHLQAGGPKLTREDLTPDEVIKIENFYAQDYEKYGDWF